MAYLGGRQQALICLASIESIIAINFIASGAIVTQPLTGLVVSQTGVFFLHIGNVSFAEKCMG
ncbi:MAG: hypothetical protein HC789_08790 [Microcoleus sp. CSU_2_2]|nr:hypothetical protein [Microcoleus sp. CSU_2_2]